MTKWQFSAKMSYICVMKIYHLTEAEAVSLTNTDTGKWMFASNFVVASAYNQSGGTPELMLYLEQQTPGGVKTGTEIGGTSEPENTVSPSFFPVATKGAECAAIVSDLSWAEKNLFAGYEYLRIQDNGQGAPKFFVNGILNSSQTQANDPFASSQPGITGPTDCACWAGDYIVGINPFE